MNICGCKKKNKSYHRILSVGKLVRCLPTGEVRQGVIDSCNSSTIHSDVTPCLRPVFPTSKAHTAACRWHWSLLAPLLQGEGLRSIDVRDRRLPLTSYWFKRAKKLWWPSISSLFFFFFCQYCVSGW